MSKSSTTNAQKFPTKSAWAKGPPQNTSSTSASASASASVAASPRSQSPAIPNPAPSNHVPQQSHSRKPSAVVTLPNKTGVNGWDSHRHKQTSSVSFGSIDDVSVPIPAVAATQAATVTPAIKSEGVKSFGSVPAAVAAHVNGKQPSRSPSAATPPPVATTTPATAVPTPATPTKKAKPMKMDIHKLFQNPSSSSPTASTPPASEPTAVSSPSIRSSGLPPQPSPAPNGPSQFGSHPYTPFVPGASQRQGPNSNNNNSNPPRSPAYNRQMSNGNNNGNSRPPNGNNNNNNSQNGLSSPRLGHPHAQPQNPPPHQPVAGWPGYYYQMGNEPYMPSYGPQWYMPQQGPPHMSAQGHPMSPMPMSPRNPQQQTPMHQQVPGTPTQNQAHALPGQHSHQNSMTSPPPTPSTAAARLNTNANAFVPSRGVKVTLKNADGTEMKLDGMKRTSVPVSSPSVPTISPSPSPAATNTNRRSIRIESPEAKQKRVAEEEAEKERVRKEKEEKERKENDEKEQAEKAKEEEARKLKEAEEKRLDEERRIKEEAEAAEAKKKAEEEEAKKKAEQEEAERVRQAEEQRLKTEAETKAAAEAEAEAAAKEKARLEEEEAAKVREAEAQKQLQEKLSAKADTEAEEGEIQAEQADEVTDTLISVTKTKEPASLHIKTLIGSATGEGMKKMRPGPLDLSYAKKNNVVAPLPSALATARIIDDLGRVSYPEGVSSPKVELNVGAKDGKFRYDRDFLLQFMSICKEKPDSLPPLDAIGLEPVEQGPGGHPLVRGGSRRGSQTGAPRPPSGANYNTLGKAAANPFNNMGNFTTSASKMSSEERFNASGNRAASVGSGPSQAGGMPFGRPPQLQRTASQGSAPGDNNRRRSQRGQKRNESNAVSSQYGSSYTNNTMGPTSSLAGESVLGSIAPLKPTESAWSARKPQAVDQDSPEMVDRKVKGLLNKLSMEKFDSISDQIITWANKSEKEKDGRTLIQVIRLVFEKATDEATWSEMYARLCRKMMETISTKVQDDGIKTDGKPIAGGQLFRKYLLNRCQEDFERGWITKEATAAAAATKAAEDQAAKDQAEASTEDDEVALYSDEYYAAQKAKRQGLGLIKFIGELFKLQMLTERIMHECVKKLLGNVENPEEEEIESLCKLLGTVGAILDTPKARAHMDVYFSRMNELTKSPNVSSRMQFMLQDVLELRQNKWIGRNTISAPTTIAQIHEAAAKETAAKDKESYQRQISMSRGGSRRGGDRGGDYGAQVGADGWAVAGNGSGPPRPPPKAGDLSNFGKIGKTAGAPMTFGPSSVFAGKKDNKREALSRASSSSNMFSMLSQGDAAVSEPPAGKSSRPPSRKASVDLTQGGIPDAPQQRKRLVLQPRSTKLSEEQSAAPAAQSDEEEESAATMEMSDDDVKKKIEEDSKEFFAVRNLDEAEVYFSNLPPSHHVKLVDKLVSVAVDNLKDAHAILVGELFARAKDKNLCTPDVFEEVFASIAEFLDDIVIDAPKAYDFMALMINAAGLDEERKARIASKSSDNDKLLALLTG